MCFVDLGIVDILDVIMSSKLLVASAGATYLRYIRLRKVKIKLKGKLPLFTDFGRSAPGVRALRLAHRDSPTFYCSFQEDILFMIQTTEAFVKNDDKHVTFHVSIV